MNFIDFLKQWLRVNERSVSWLARKCDVSPAAAKYWLDKKHKPSPKHEEIIKEVIGL
tara:strand:- start:27 stop:197 length:171 start_codon:yes stop_codon:yes gene_type:complete